MTVRERNLWLMVGGVFLAAVLYSIFNPAENRFFRLPRSKPAQTLSQDYLSAARLLRSKNVILGRKKDTAHSLSGLKTGFYSRANPDEAQLKLLKQIEQVSDQVRLGVSQKSLVQFKNDTIGVMVEGKTGQESFFRFLDRIRSSEIYLKVQRLQIHALPEEKMLNYQIVITTRLIEKEN